MSKHHWLAEDEDEEFADLMSRREAIVDRALFYAHLLSAVDQQVTGPVQLYSRDVHEVASPAGGPASDLSSPLKEPDTFTSVLRRVEGTKGC